MSDRSGDETNGETDQELYCPNCGQYHSVNAHLTDGGIDQ